VGIVVTVPHAKKPDSDPSAVAFTKQLESIMDIRDIPNYILYGNSPRNMLDLSTSEARGTGYNSDLASALRVASILLEVHDFDSASDPTFEEDFVFVEIAKCDTGVIDQALAITNNFANVDTERLEASKHYPSALAILSFEIPTLIVYVNRDSTDLFPAVSEALVELAEAYVQRKTVEDGSEVSIVGNPQQH
jgi:hypothetical protein